VLDKCSSRSVYIGVCPVLFAFYVRLRNVKRAAHVFSVSTIDKCFEDYNEHIRACMCEKKVNNALSRAYIISSVKSTD